MEQVRKILELFRPSAKTPARICLHEELLLCWFKTLTRHARVRPTVSCEGAITCASNIASAANCTTPSMHERTSRSDARLGTVHPAGGVGLAGTSGASTLFHKDTGATDAEAPTKKVEEQEPAPGRGRRASVSGGG